MHSLPEPLGPMDYMPRYQSSLWMTGIPDVIGGLLIGISLIGGGWAIYHWAGRLL
jgi:hypothetical protein